MLTWFCFLYPSFLTVLFIICNDPAYDFQKHLLIILIKHEAERLNNFSLSFHEAFRKHIPLIFILTETERHILTAWFLSSYKECSSPDI